MTSSTVAKNIDISLMAEADISYAYSLTEIEQWGYLEDDFKRLMSWEPKGCFVARYEDKPVGIITSTSYDDFAFIGSLIIERSSRGQGMGEKLMAHTIKYLKSKSVKTIELDAVIPALSLYRRFGFKDKYLSLRFKRPVSNKYGILSPCSPDRKEIIIDLDKRLTGLNRTRMIESYFKMIPDNIFAIRDEKLRAYTIIRPRSDKSFEIGPLICESTPEVEGLFNCIVRVFGDKVLSIGVPAINQDAIDMVVKYGFEYCQPSLRMFLGERLDYERNIYGIFSAEKG